jgi:hypothetical protein
LFLLQWRNQRYHCAGRPFRRPGNDQSQAKAVRIPLQLIHGLNVIQV